MMEPTTTISTPSATTAVASSFIPKPELTVSFITSMALRGLGGYFVGKLLGYPVAGAVATAALGLPGMLGVAIYSKHGGK